MTTLTALGTAIAALTVTAATLHADQRSASRSSDRAERCVLIDFSDQYNARNDTDNLQRRGFFASDRLPTGFQTFRTVPFQLGPAHGDYAWSAAFDEGLVRTLEIDTAVESPKTVYTLISTFWGSSEPGQIAIEFLGSDGAFHREELVGNKNVRDYNRNASFTNRISASNVTRVFSNHRGQRLDMQVWVLPDDFKDETLAQIRVVDTGQNLVNRAVVFGITVETVDADAPRREALALLDRARAERAGSAAHPDTGVAINIDEGTASAVATDTGFTYTYTINVTEVPTVVVFREDDTPTVAELLEEERQRRQARDTNPH